MGLLQRIKAILTLRRRQEVLEHESLLERTARRQRAASEALKRRGRHVLTGYTPPRFTDLRRTFAAMDSTFTGHTTPADL